MKTAYTRVVIPIGVDTPYPVEIGAPRNIESMSVSANSVVLNITVDQEVNPGPCNLMALRIGSTITSPYERIAAVTPNVLLTGNCFG